MKQIKYLFVKSLHPTIQFYDFPDTSLVVLGFTHTLLSMLKSMTKELSSYQVYLSCKIPPMLLHDKFNPAPPSSY